MDFHVILLMFPICSAILWLKSRVPALNKIWSAILWLFSAPSDIKYILDELAWMQDFLERAELGGPATANNKRKLISQIRELACDAEDCIGEFKRLLVQPTDEEIFRRLLSTGVLLRDGAGTWFLKIGTWLLGTSAGVLFCGVITCSFLGVGTCLRFLVTVLELGTPLLIRTAVELHDSLLRTGLELGFPLLIRTSLDPLLIRTSLHLIHLTDHEIIGLFLRIGDLLWSTGAVTCFLKISTSFLVLKISTSFLRTQLTVLQRLCTRFLRSARARFLRIGLELRTCFEGDTYWLRTSIECSTRFLRKVHAQYQIKTEVQRIKASVEQEHIREIRYNVIPKAVNAPSGRHLERHPSRLNAHFIPDVELVGIDGPRDELLGWLLDGNRAQTCVISVVGCGGLGKTTLVRRAFENQRIIDGGSFGHFDCRAWFTVSASFELMDFLKKVFQQLFDGLINQELDLVRLIEQVRAYLQDKRYLIIFDDVWTVDAWKNIQLMLPVNMRGSRIVVTTRDENVAYTCCVPYPELVYKLPTLSVEGSWQLFNRRVFNGDHCPHELEVVSEEILKKCGGVPLIIATIGSVLASEQSKTVNVWKYMLDLLGSGLENNPSLEGMMQIMALSYDALPSHLKRCFLLLSIFPEDYRIQSEKLQALWIAEGFVKCHGDVTLKEAAESYFKELICRNLLLVSGNNVQGQPKWCQVHDVMHAFVVSKSEEEKNIVILNKTRNTLMTPEGVSRRRLSLHQSEPLFFPSEIMRSDHLRSLFVFGFEPYEPPPHSHEFASFIYRSKFLRVLELSDVSWLSSCHIREIGKLYHLRYLNLRGTRVDCIPESFGELQNLEFLDARSASFDTIVPAAAVVKLPNLRHLRGWCIEAAQGPWSSKALQTLDCLRLPDGSEGVVRELRNLNQLRKLAVEGLQPDQGMDFCDSISKMSSCLRFLKVHFDAGYTMGYLDSLASPPVLLQSLKLDGYLGSLPGWINSLQAVSKIVLFRSRLQFDAIQALKKLPNLVKLEFNSDAYIGTDLYFNGKGFDRLKTLKFLDIPLESLYFGAGSVPSLEDLQIWHCDLLCEIGNFDGENLPRLKTIYCIGTEKNMRFQLDDSIEAHPNNPSVTWIYG